MRVCPRCASETELALCPRDGVATFAVQQGMQTYPAGTVIAERYRVERALGIGGFGAVYLCTQLAMEQRVAVKVLRSEHLSSVEHVKRFTREAQAVSRLKHPNTIHIFDFGVHQDGALYLAMEYLEGETLADRLDRNQRLPWRQLVHVAVQICHSLTEAHAVGLVHRDLKPENIMLLPVAGDTSFVKVLDFGIAKVQDPSRPQQSNLTEAGMIMGTPTYMSPEQAKGEEIDARSDLYALGVMMYESLTGRPPFADETAMKVLVAHIKDQPKPFAREGAVAEIPQALEQIVLQCLAKEPVDRPQTAALLAEVLRATLTEPDAVAAEAPAAERPVLAAAIAAVGGGKVPLPAAPMVQTAPHAASGAASLLQANAASPSVAGFTAPLAALPQGIARSQAASTPAQTAAATTPPRGSHEAETTRQVTPEVAAAPLWAQPVAPPLAERSPSTQLALAGAAAPFAAPARVPAPTLAPPRKPAVIGVVVFLAVATAAVLAVVLLAPQPTADPAEPATGAVARPLAVDPPPSDPAPAQAQTAKAAAPASPKTASPTARTAAPAASAVAPQAKVTVVPPTVRAPAVAAPATPPAAGRPAATAPVPAPAPQPPRPDATAAAKPLPPKPEPTPADPPKADAGRNGPKPDDFRLED